MALWVAGWTFLRTSIPCRSATVIRAKGI